MSTDQTAIAPMRCNGVGRNTEWPKSLLFYFSSVPTDDQMRYLRARWDIISTRGLPKLRPGGDHIVFSGKRWPVRGTKSWVGNWCWDAWWFAPATGWAFPLHGRRLFKCEGGESWFCDLWDGPEWPAAPDQGFLVRWQEEKLR